MAQKLSLPRPRCGGPLHARAASAGSGRSRILTERTRCSSTTNRQMPSNRCRFPCCALVFLTHILYVKQLVVNTASTSRAIKSIVQRLGNAPISPLNFRLFFLSLPTGSQQTEPGRHSSPGPGIKYLAFLFFSLARRVAPSHMTINQARPATTRTVTMVVTLQPEPT